MGPVSLFAYFFCPVCVLRRDGGPSLGVRLTITTSYISLRVRTHSLMFVSNTKCPQRYIATFQFDHLCLRCKLWAGLPKIGYNFRSSPNPISRNFMCLIYYDLFYHSLSSAQM